jgi:hypothetical protein
MSVTFDERDITGDRGANDPAADLTTTAVLSAELAGNLEVLRTVEGGRDPSTQSHGGTNTCLRFKYGKRKRTWREAGGGRGFEESSDEGLTEKRSEAPKPESTRGRRGN